MKFPSLPAVLANMARANCQGGIALGREPALGATYAFIKDKIAILGRGANFGGAKFAILKLGANGKRSTYPG